MREPPEIFDGVPPSLRSAAAGPPPPPAPRQKLGLNIALFALTFASSLYSQTPMHRGESLADFLAAPLTDPTRLHMALPFATTLLAILLAHEMGHYLTARRYGVQQSLPYFIPAPFTLFGTLGAVIVMRSQPQNRRMLLNVAVMGPYAGMALALPAAAWGLAHSTPIDPERVAGGLMFGDSVLFAALERWFSPNGTDVVLHPVALAGWVGLFITSLNLIPAAQLDGGHVVYALFGRVHEKISLAVAVGLFYFGLHNACLGDVHGDGQGGAMWLVWAFLLFIIGIRHPPVQDESITLTLPQRANAAAALALFCVTFIPIPMRVIAPEVSPAEAPELTQPWGREPADEVPEAPEDEDEAPAPDAPRPGGHRPEEFRL